MNSALWFILKQLLGAALRIEKKLDEALADLAYREAKASGVPRNKVPLNYGGQSCPLCQKPVVYKPVRVAVPVGGDLEYAKQDVILVRVCGCVPETRELPIDEGELP